MAAPYRAALITGAGSGLGRELALIAAGQGCAIAALDVRAEGLQDLAEVIAARKQTLHWAVADVTKASALAACVRELEAKTGPLDLAIASAGIGKQTSAVDFNADVMAQVIGVNLIGVSNTLAAVVPGMLQRQRGHLVALSSLASYKGMPGMLAYCASKSGVNAIMEGMRVEVEPHGLRVSTICPGWVRTSMTSALHSAIPNMLTVEAAAAEIWRAIRQGKRFHAFPSSMVWQARLMSWLPRRWSDPFIRKMFKKLPRLE